ncbi:sensor histidine kinase [Perlucidibaca piscinae]|uniref:sensor histidine kinase n=1 Tax=Perlucidibaca piscinae TaxID=392589 RepID=UPI0003B6138B|nr:7TM-DISM domain-containing protein [Perlucidibaca piscinae]
MSLVDAVQRRSVIAVLLVVLAIGWVLSLTSYSPVSGDRIIARSFLADASRSLGLEEVRQVSFQPFQGGLSRGNRDEHLWLRLILPPLPDRGWVLQFEPAYLRDVTVFQRDEAGQWQTQRGGLHHAFVTRELPLLNYVVPVRTDVRRETVIYARIDTPTAFSMARVLQREDAQYQDGLMNFTAGLALGVVLILMLSSLALWLLTRDEVWLYHLILDLAALILFYFLLGLASKYLLPNVGGVADRIVVFCSCLLQFCVSLTFPRVFRVFGLPGWTVAAYRAGLVIFPALCLAMFLGHDALALSGNHALILLQNLWGISILIKARHHDAWLLWTFRVMFGLFMVHAMHWVWPLLLDGGAIGLQQLYPSVLGNLFVLAMLMVMLLRKTRLDVREHQEGRLRSALAEQHLSQEKLRHQDTSAFLGMMMHELRNPLNSIRMVEYNMSAESRPERDGVRLARIRDAVNDMDRVLNLSIEVDTAEQGAVRIDCQPMDLMPLIRQDMLSRASRIELEGDVRVAIINSDATVLRLILANLIDNALKYSPADSPIRLRVEIAQETVSLRVTNAVGVSGMPDPQRVFDKYYRTPGATPMSGMGLGLYWIKLVTRLLNARISCAIATDRIEFLLCLPR